MKYQSIQSLRGIAALLVLYVHSGLSPKIGAFGVDIFFVLSGAIMAMVIQKDNVGAAEFIKARVLRIWPLYFMISMLFALSLSIKNPALAPSYADYLGTTFLFPFSPDSGWKPLLFVGWTLHYEMFFYLCCALAIRVNRDYASIITALLLVVCFGVSSVLEHLPLARFFSNPLLLEFIGGVAIWHMSKRGLNIPPKIGIYCGTAFLAIALICESIAPGIAIPGQELRRFVVFAIPAFVIVWIVISADLGGNSLFGKCTLSLSKIGDSSYAIYLVHIPVLLVTKNLLAVYDIDNHVLLGIILFPAALTVGSFIHKKVDSPLQKKLCKFK